MINAIAEMKNHSFAFALPLSLFRFFQMFQIWSLFAEQKSSSIF